MSVYAYVSWAMRVPPEQIVRHVYEQGCSGIYYYAGGPDYLGAAEYRDRCARLGLELLFGYRCQPTDDARADAGRQISAKLSLGNDWHGEYNGDVALAAQYRAQAARLGHEWICPIIHPRIVWDLRERALRSALDGVRCFTFTGYMLAAYIYNDVNLPYHNDGVFAGHNVAEEYGLTEQALQKYLDGWSVWTGAGFQAGLNAGSRIYAKRLGFRDVVVGVPFDLTDSFNVPVRGLPDRPPLAWGTYV